MRIAHIQLETIVFSTLQVTSMMEMVPTEGLKGSNYLLLIFFIIFDHAGFFVCVFGNILVTYFSLY